MAEFVATLLCDPARPALDDAVVAALRDAWGGGTIRWLASGVAAEFPLAMLPDDRARVGDTLRARGVDVAVQPAAGRARRMLLADMDSTMVGQECIDELAEAAGVGDRVAGITGRAMAGELDFAGALRERVALLAGLPAATIDRVLAGRITHAPGGATLVATMRAHGAYTVLVSGGFTAFAEPVGAALGFDEARANTLLAEGGRLTGAVAEPVLGREAKLAALEEATRRLGIGAEDVLAVGDGANDLGMLERAGAGVAMHAKPAVAEACGLRIDHGDLTALLYLQGYADADFVVPARG